MAAAQRTPAPAGWAKLLLVATVVALALGAAALLLFERSTTVSCHELVGPTSVVEDIPIHGLQIASDSQCRFAVDAGQAREISLYLAYAGFALVVLALAALPWARWRARQAVAEV